jgi:hypothetical protein
MGTAALGRMIAIHVWRVLRYRSPAQILIAALRRGPHAGR